MRALTTLLLLGVAWATPKDFTPPLKADPSGAQIIVLRLSPCLIKEAETAPMKYSATDAKRCEQLNRAAKVARDPGIKRMRLVAGDYIFRVYNDDVPWPVDFAIKGHMDESLPKTGGGQMKAGQGLAYKITLTPGSYLYSSPLNATYDYHLLVESPPKR